MAMVLRNGPAAGHAVEDDARPVIWVAVLDDGIYVLSDRLTDGGEDVEFLLRARGRWAQYERVADAPAYAWADG